MKTVVTEKEERGAETIRLRKRAKTSKLRSKKGKGRLRGDRTIIRKGRIQTTMKSQNQHSVN